MKENILNGVYFEHDGHEYEFGFGFNEVKALSAYTSAKKGVIKDIDFFKFALQKNSKVSYISDKKAKEIQELFVEGIDIRGDHLTYEEIIGQLMTMYVEAIDEESKKYEPALVTFNKDGSAKVVVEGQPYELKYTRKIIEENHAELLVDYTNLLELYNVGSILIKNALKQSNEKMSTTTSEKIFLAIWGTKFEEGNEQLFADVIQNLLLHMKEVVESGAKKSKGVLQAKVR